MTRYVIEYDRTEAAWVLRRFGTHYVMERGSTMEAVRESAFGRLRGFAPCRLRVVDPFGEWTLERMDEGWVEATAEGGA